MELRSVDAKTLDEFVRKNSKSHFMQTSGWANVASSRGYIHHMLGLFNNEELKATALLLEKKIGPFSTFYCPRGPIVDYEDKELLKTLFSLLKTYVYVKKGLYLKIDLDLIIRKLDEDAKPISENINNIELINILKSIGFKHRGFTTKFYESSNPRFTFRKDVSLNDEELLNSFHATTKKILKRNNPYKLVIRKGDIKDVEEFYVTMQDTSKRKQMYLESKEYFTNFYSLLNKQGMSDIFVVEANIETLKEVYRNKQQELDLSYKELDKYSDNKKETLRNELDNAKRKLEKEIAIINQIKEEKVVLSSIITAKFADKVWTIHGGNSDTLMFLNGNYELYYAILKDSRDNGYKYVDFFGSEGEVNKDSSIYGIYLFKQRFAGDFDEFIGEFDLVTRPLFNSIISKLLKLRRNVMMRNSTK